MLRAALCWLVAGAAAGLTMMADRWVSGAWRAWFAPTHGHMLFVGWFLQFTLGVAYWLLPRTRTPVQPLGYRERWGFAAMAALNTGLALRVVTEPITRAGHDTPALDLVLVCSGALQLAAVALFASQLWPRLAPRVRKPLSHA